MNRLPISLSLSPLIFFAVAYTSSKRIWLSPSHNRAIERDPAFAIAYNNRGNAYRHQGDYQQAIADYNRAIERDPAYANPHWGLGNTYYEQERFAEALAAYRRYVELAGANPSSFVLDRIAELEARLE